MIVKFKKLNSLACTPVFATEGAAAADLTAVSVDYIDKFGNSFIPVSFEDWKSVKKVKYNTGLSFEFPKGYVMLLFPRSSVMKQNLSLSNSVGVIDSDYRGEVSAVFYVNDESSLYGVGDRCCQIMLLKLPEVTFNEVSELSETERGDGGYGSTGK